MSGLGGRLEAPPSAVFVTGTAGKSTVGRLSEEAVDESIVRWDEAVVLPGEQ